MEMVIGYKQTAELDVAKHMTKYIAQQYSEREAARQRDACHEFAEQREALRLALREERVTLEQLQHYYHRLEGVAAHFPISERETRLTFVWYDALSTKKKCGLCNLALERSATIFNMAAAYASQAAHERQMMTEAGTKQASRSFQCAAACFFKLRTAFVPILGDPITSDLSLTVVSALEKLMQAEAQELWLSQAEAKSMKKSLPGLTQGTMSLWQEAQRFISAGNLGKSLPGKAAHYVDMRVCWLAANAQIHYISHPEHLDVTVEPGKAIARLRIAAEQLAKALVLAKKQPHKSVEERVALVAADVDAQLQRLEKDNNDIYHDTIPLAGQLEPIKSLVVIKPVELSLSGSFGGDGGLTDDPWESLVSVDEYAAVQSFKEQEQQISPQLVQELGGTLDEHTAKAQEQLGALGLPHALDGLDTPSGEIPQRLLRKIKALHDKGGVDGLEAAVRDVQVKADNRVKIITSCDDILKCEAAEDARYREQYGSQWTAKTSEAKTLRLRKEWSATKTLCMQEAQKLEQIHSQIKAARPDLELVSAPIDEIIKQVPSSLGASKPSVAAEVEELSTQLTQQIGELEELCEARTAIQEAWREAAASVDIRGALRGSDPMQREALMKMELQKYDAPAAAARKSVTEQARILQAIGAAHAEFIRLKPPQNEVDRFVQQFFNRCTSAIRVADRLRNEFDSLVAERARSAKHFVRLEPECIRYVEKRANKREVLLHSLGVAHPRAYRPQAARTGNGSRDRGGKGSQSGARGRRSDTSHSRHHGSRGRGGSPSPHHHTGAGRSKVRRSSVDRSIQISTSGNCTWWWRSSSKAGSDGYKPYSDEQSSRLEAAFVAYTSGDDSQQTASLAQIALSSEYVVDFATMRQINVHDERKSRPVQRREKDGTQAAVQLPEARPPSPETEAEPEPISTLPEPTAVPVPSAPVDLLPNASEEAVMMGFDPKLVERVQADQRAACGTGYENILELLPALQGREEQEQADTDAVPTLAPAPPVAVDDGTQRPSMQPVAFLPTNDDDRSQTPTPSARQLPLSPASAEVPAAPGLFGDQPVAVWEWKADRGWKPYSSEQTMKIEAEFKRALFQACGGDSSFVAQQQPPQGRIVLDAGTHAIDFGKMRQVNISDEKRSRAVRRSEKQVAPTHSPSPGSASPLSPDSLVTPPAVDEAEVSSAGGARGLAPGVWEWKADRGWKPYSQEQSTEIEQAFVTNAGKGEHVLEGGAYAVDFSHMRQVKTSDRRRSRAVRRVEKRDKV